MKVYLLAVFFLNLELSSSLLYPQDSELRETKSLDGRWDFVASPKLDQNIGFKEKWYQKKLTKVRPHDVIAMPVPSSYNDITQEVSLRDYIGVVWYQRSFWVPKRWKNAKQRVVLRFGSAHYSAIVYVNGVEVVHHAVGHLPFEVEVTAHLQYNKENTVTVALNNTLTQKTIPQGEVIHHNDRARYPPGYITQKLQFDFFNYAGLHRPVLLYTTSPIFIRDIVVQTDVVEDLSAAAIKYKIEVGGKMGGNKDVAFLSLFDDNDVVVANAKGLTGVMKLKNPKLWWPIFMDKDPGYLYTLEAHLVSDNGSDVYRLPIGIRSVNWNITGLYINHRQFYFRGFGKHEDADIRGKGFDWPLVLKDFNLLEWIGANSFRTSHYPYAEEIMQEADRRGIVVIDECPAVGLSVFNSTMLSLHAHIMEALVQRDKNHPSVVMWSIANEPKSSNIHADFYFRELVEMTKSMDPSRAVTAAVAQSVYTEKAAQHLDIVMINRYYAWYYDLGHPELIQKQLIHEFDLWRNKFKKPIMLSEYGADTIAGLHTDPPFIFTEDYQTEVLLHFFKAFQELRNKGWIAGELIWNFADFMTDQQLNRVVGNKKGLFTRNRQPKAAAKALRCHYLLLAVHWDKSPSNTTVPDYCKCQF